MHPGVDRDLRMNTKVSVCDMARMAWIEAFSQSYNIIHSLCLWPLNTAQGLLTGSAKACGKCVCVLCVFLCACVLVCVHAHACMRGRVFVSVSKYQQIVQIFFSIFIFTSCRTLHFVLLSGFEALLWARCRGPMRIQVGIHSGPVVARYVYAITQRHM